MPKIAANLSHLWAELPYLDRFEAATDAGFDGVEVLFPYDMPAKDTQRALLRCGLPMILMNAPPPNYTGGPRGFAAVAGLEARFQYDLRRAMRYCEALKVPMLHIMTGDGEGPEARAILVENLRYATQAVGDRLMLTLEPLNQTAMPAYFLGDYALAAEILEEVGAPNLGLQFDSYHSQMIHGDAVQVFETYATYVRHVQIGDTPGRTAPGTGKVDFQSLLGAVKSTGYDGWISAEYTPDGRTEEGLGWLQSFRDVMKK